MMMQYAWLIWSLAFLAVWLLFFFLRKDLRKEMWWVSLATMPLGLTEPLFVPEYWNPPTLFDLAQKTGFDIESLIFCFSIGGVGSVIYKLIYKTQILSVSESEKLHKRHRWHKLILVTPIVVFLLLAILTPLDHIYCGVLAMSLGALASLYCRPDLKYKIFVGGALFLGFYAILFLSLIWVLPNYVTHVWNLNALTGIMIFGVPVEEFLFAFSFGMLWSSLYEHIMWFKLTDKKK